MIIEAVAPEIDAGQHAIKRSIGESITVEADIFADGHDVLAAVISYRHTNDGSWREVEMTHRDNDRWSGTFCVTRLGSYLYTVEAWVDHFLTWRRDLQKKGAAGQDVGVELMGGAMLVRASTHAASPVERDLVETWARAIADTTLPLPERVSRALDPAISALMHRHGDRSLATRHPRELRVTVETVRARYGAWYELFPRSVGSDGRRHGSLRDLAAAGPGDPGSPWGVGAFDGGHTAVHPELGTLDDFRALVQQARGVGVEIALDLAFQCSPDHPYVREHPSWFKRRADGCIQYAENPPKKYQDIYPLDFETNDWRELWAELRSVIEFWIAEGVTIFRVDNPHTKAFPFWQWVIGALKAERPELIFLSEAFTRPKVMYHLAKVGFTQSYNYFPWRNTRREIEQFMTELTRSPAREYYRPNLWPNTPDILPHYLQFGGRAGFMIRLVLAATLGASYGIYGPAFELCVDQPRAVGEEEYLHSEKYQLKAWALDDPASLEPLITQINGIRRENPALHANDSLFFHDADNPDLITYSKRTADRENTIVVVVNLDPHHTQRGFVRLDLHELGIEPTDTFQVHDLLTGSRYLWRAGENFVELVPGQLPAAIFRIRRRIRSERDFDYFM